MGTALAAAVVAPLLGTALAVGPAEAQTRASLDAGVSRVTYEGFLPSAAFSLSPAIGITGSRLGLTARASWLRFESGNNSIRGLVSGSYSLPASAGGGAAADFSTELGGSRYEQFTSFSHVLGRARLRWLGSGDRGGWLAATAGVVASEGEQRPVGILSGAFRLDGRDIALTLAGAATLVGGVAYTDLETGVRHGRPGGFGAEAVLSVRAGDRGGKVGPFFEATLTAPVTRYAALVLGGGRYAEDVVRGNLGGHYLTAAVRVAPTMRPRRLVPPSLPTLQPMNDGATVAAALVEVRRGRGNACTLVFRAGSGVELMADFTDWVPTTLQPTGPDLWSLTLSIAPGRYRLNVRVDGGPWGVPAGTTPVTDDFQGLVGMVIIR